MGIGDTFLNPNTVVGRIQPVPGPAEEVPFSQLTPALLTALALPAGASQIGFLPSGTTPLYGWATRTAAAKMSDSVNLKDFKNSNGTAVACDGVQDDTTGFQAAAAYIDVTGQALIIPSKSVRVTGKISFAKPPVLIGEAYSPPIFGGYATKNTVILSEITNDYVLEINNSATYYHGLNIVDVHVLASGGGSAGKGVLLRNCGWGGHTKGFVVEGFTGGGVTMSQMQDSVFDQLQIVSCGTDGTIPALYITAGSNSLKFLRPHLDANVYQLKIDNATAQCFCIEFYDPHIEQETTAPANPPVVLSSCGNGIKFFGGYLGPATIANTIIAHGALVPSTCPYFVQATSCSEVVFIGSTIGSGTGDSKTLKFDTSDGVVLGCKFQFATVKDYSIYLKGNIQFKDNSIDLNDIGAAATAFYGIYGEGALVKDNWIVSQNGATSAKLSGSVFASTSGNKMRLGQNVVSISKKFQFTDGNCFIYGYQPDDVQTGDFTGTVDARLWDPHKIFVPTVLGVHTLFSNPCVNQMFTIQNLDPLGGGAFNFTVTNGGGNVLKGAVNAVMTKYNHLTLLMDPVNGTHTEVSRNF